MTKSFVILNFLSRVIILPTLVLCLFSALLYAQNESSEQQNNNSSRKKGVVREFLRVNKEASKNLDRAADIIDRKLSPAIPKDTDPADIEELEPNKTQVYFVIGGDFDDRGHIETNFRYGVQLHLPRFERYWKVKFANQDEKRERGQSTMTREQRTRNTNDDVFLGVNFQRNWKGVNFDYKPQIAFDHNLGLDHSIEVSSEYQRSRFVLKPSFEIFGNHGEGLGNSAVLGMSLGLLRNVHLHQGNTARFVYSNSNLQVNHVVGIGFSPTDRFGISANYFRSFVNPEESGFELSAYGYYLATSYVIYRNILNVEVQPYMVYERVYGFELTNGVLINFRVQF